MAERKFKIFLNVNNIGPHFVPKHIEFSDEVDSNKAVFFATNGTGKSFISRAIRLTADEKQTKNADDLLTLGKNSGNLSFCIVDNTEKQLSVSIERGMQPTILNTTDLIFHVFNSDFVEENIKPKHFTPDGNIEGYILGKTQIDLSLERELEEKLKKEIEILENTIETEISNAKQELRTQGVISSTIEFSLIEKIRLRNNEIVGDVPSFEKIVEQLDILSKVPEKLDDVKISTLTIEQSIFEKIIDMLTTTYPTTEWDKEFVAEIKTNREFIVKGLDLSGDSKNCPFCKQIYDSDTLSLIRKYKTYLTDKEAELLQKINLYKKSIEEIVTSLQENIQSTKNSFCIINDYKKYFPSLSEIELIISDIKEPALQVFKDISDFLDEKSINFSKTFPTIEDFIAVCKTKINITEDVNKNNIQAINTVNNTIHNNTGERLSLRRNLCKAQYIKYREKLKMVFLNKMKK